ncbi:MAG: diguanylate cyclase [Thermodesulfobacteriota bacterium]|nr:diguanylate cyclase [Thermodesulfobacteriota bacterium]
MKKMIFVTCFLWTFVNVGSLSFAVFTTRNKREMVHLQSARSFFKKIEITRSWNALHGGVYVPVTEKTRPNPYLKTPMRDITVNPELTLTKINPSLMTRQLADMTATQKGIKLRITSLDLLNPENFPLEREKKALMLFNKGIKETWKFFTENNQPIFFYMAPLKTDSSCLKCHDSQGYRKGDIRGGISITIPALGKIPLKEILLIHIILLLFGLGVIFFFGTALNRAYDDLKRQAAIDGLTGLLNRRSFSQRISIEFAACRRKKEPLSIIMCDVDFFKKFNDTYGHKAGDDCLIQVADALKQSLNRPGDFCARYGGEEFVVVLPYTSQNGAMHVAEKIRQKILDLNIPRQQPLS